MNNITKRGFLAALLAAPLAVLGLFKGQEKGYRLIWSKKFPELKSEIARWDCGKESKIVLYRDGKVVQTAQASQ